MLLLQNNQNYQAGDSSYGQNPLGDPVVNATGVVAAAPVAVSVSTAGVGGVAGGGGVAAVDVAARIAGVVVVRVARAVVIDDAVGEVGKVDAIDDNTGHYKGHTQSEDHPHCFVPEESFVRVYVHC